MSNIEFSVKVFSKTVFERLRFEFLSGHFVLRNSNDCKNNQGEKLSHWNNIYEMKSFFNDQRTLTAGEEAQP